jgi:hypothetical protein
MSTLSERWAVLRDREALGELLSSPELEDANNIEGSDPEVRSYVMQMRELESYLEGKRGTLPTAPDHQLVLRALSAVQVTSPSPRVLAIDHDAELAREADPEGPWWIRMLATSASVAMTVAAALALFLYEPRSVRHASQAAASASPRLKLPASAEPLLPAPQVESLLIVRSSERGARLRRDDKLLAPSALLSQGDEISSGEKPGCVVIDQALEVCLAPSSTVKLKNLSVGHLTLDLWRGKLSLYFTASELTRGYAVNVGDVRLAADSNAVTGLERNEDASSVRARVLRGEVSVSSGPRALRVAGGHSALYRADGDRLEIQDLLPGAAQREWELVAAGKLGAAGAPVFPSGEAAREAPLAAEEGAVATTPSTATEGGVEGAAPAPRELMQAAWELLKSERWQEAADVYERIAREAPGSEESHIVLVRLGDLLLERLGSPARALTVFDRYLAEGGGALAAEARHSRIAAFRRLAQPALEQAAIEEFLRFHPESAHATVLQARLKVLSP